tara:strand:- start:7 stop:483 length:477 start_codon:yes stop_codon:yes gene_type:complete
MKSYSRLQGEKFIPTPLHFNSVERGIKEGIHLLKPHYPDIESLDITKAFVIIRKLAVLSICLQNRETLKEGELDKIITYKIWKLESRESSKELSALELFKAIECILVQLDIDVIDEIIGELSEFDRWAITVLIIYKDQLKDLIIDTIPGYEDIPWEIE